MKKFIYVLVMLFMTVFSYGQVTAPAWSGNLVSSTVSSVDTVTIGGVMPYQVYGDPNMHALRRLGILNYSNFSWVASGGTLRNISGVNLSTPNASDTTVSVYWDGLGTQSISVTEAPQVISGPAFTCTANTVTLSVEVINRPTAIWNGSPSASGCSVDGTTVTIPYTLTGIGLFDVTYNIAYTNLSGIITNVVNNVTLNSLGNYQKGSLNFTFSYDVPSNAYGKYDVTIISVTDRISRKSGISTISSDIPNNASTFYAYPTPVTQPVRYVKNL